MRTRRSWQGVDKRDRAARETMDRHFQIHKALEAIFDVVADGDRYIDARRHGRCARPIRSAWKTVLYVTAETVRQIAILLHSPSCRNRRQSCSISSPFRPTSAISTLGDRPLVAGHVPAKAPPGFPRYVAPEEGT
jgi:methionyl-tRNA synthetase